MLNQRRLTLFGSTTTAAIVAACAVGGVAATDPTDLLIKVSVSGPRDVDLAGGEVENRGNGRRWESTYTQRLLLTYSLRS